MGADIFVYVAKHDGTDVQPIRCQHLGTIFKTPATLRVLGFNLFKRNRTKRHLICIQQVPGRSKVTRGRPLERRGVLWVLLGSKMSTIDSSVS